MPTSTQTFKLIGVTCAGCVNQIEKVLSKHIPKDHFQIDFPKKQLMVTHPVSADKIIKLIKTAGYEAILLKGGESPQEDNKPLIRKRFIQRAAEGVVGLISFFIS